MSSCYDSFAAQSVDWCRLGGSYFEVSAVTEVWRKGWEITAWRMPLSQLTEESAAAGFLIERPVEPTPETTKCAGATDSCPWDDPLAAVVGGQ